MGFILKRLFRFVLLIPISAFTLFFLYPLVHECGHALATLILGGKISAVSLFPVPHVESGIPHDNMTIVALVSLAGMIFPLLTSLPFIRARGYIGFVVLLMLLICSIAYIVELSIAIQYSAGIVVAGDDIVLFLQASGLRPIWAYAYTGILCIWAVIAIVYMNPLALIDGLA